MHVPSTALEHHRTARLYLRIVVFLAMHSNIDLGLFKARTSRKAGGADVMKPLMLNSTHNQNLILQYGPGAASRGERHSLDSLVPAVTAALR
jgi:hypothetical protein